MLDAQSGQLKRAITGASVGHPSSVAVDPLHGELFVGMVDPTTGVQQIVVYDAAATGAAVPKRTLGGGGTPTAPTVGAWAIAYDRIHDELVTSCNCDDRVAFLDRTAAGDVAPKRAVHVSGVSKVHGLLRDDGADTVWVEGPGTLSFMLAEIPHDGTGTVAPLRPSIIPSAQGRLAPCN